jgi:hypothetical protein
MEFSNSMIASILLISLITETRGCQEQQGSGPRGEGLAKSGEKH